MGGLFGAFALWNFNSLTFMTSNDPNARTLIADTAYIHTKYARIYCDHHDKYNVLQCKVYVGKLAYAYSVGVTFASGGLRQGGAVLLKPQRAQADRVTS